MPVDLVSLRNALLHNKRLKALALLMAVLTWYVIQDAISFEVEIPEIRLQIQVRDGMAILDQSASAVDVTFRGSQEDIQRLDPRRLSAVVELAPDTGPLPQEIKLTPAMIQGVRGARIMAIHPATIHVTLDRQAEKRVPVKGRTAGVPLFGEVQDITCEPSTVLLRGPAAKLKTTEAVYTQPVDVDGRVETFMRRAPVSAPGDNWVAEMDPADVQVKVTIMGRKNGEVWNEVPVSALVGPGRGMQVEIEPPKVTVWVMGRLAVQGGATGVEVRAYADCLDLREPGSYSVPVRVHVSGTATGVARPEQVKVTLRAPAGGGG